MKILFVKPNMGLVGGKPYEDRGRMEPLTFAVLAGATPEGHELALVDDRFEKIPYDDEVDLVAINTEIYTAKRAYEIADQFRRRGRKVVLGGYHTTMIPHESANHADAVVVGDGEQIWPILVRDAQNRNLRRRYDGIGCEGSIDHLRIDWRIFSGKSYLPVRLTQFGRGCQHACEYCATGQIYQRRHCFRPVDQVIGELEKQKSRWVFFIDDNLIANKTAIKLLLRKLIPLKKRWIGQADLSFAEDGELMELLLRSGCKGLVVGFESLDRRNLAQMRKNCNFGFEGYDGVVERIRSAGIMVWAAFLLGYDSDTVASVRETCEWALSKKFAFSAFNILMPYPATRLYRRMKEEKRLLYNGRWWLDERYRFGYPGMQPKNCSPEELAQACLDARLRHSSVYQIIRRAADRKTHMQSIENFFTYFIYNPLFRDEMKKKHGMQLGYRGLER